MKTTIPFLLLIAVVLTGCDRSADSGADQHTDSPDTEPAQAHFTIVDVFDLGRRGVRNFTFCPATRRLYVSFMDSKDDLLYEFDVDTGEVTHTYQLGNGYMCDSVAVSPDGDHLVVGCWPFSGSESKTLIVQTTPERTMLALELTDRTFWPKFSADGSFFWTRGGAFDLSGRPMPDVRRKKPEAQEQSAWCIWSSKTTIETHGLYYRDADGKDHHLTQNQWHDNYCITQDKEFIVATTWDGELIVWRTDDCREVFRRKLASQYGYLAYDPQRSRVLLGDATRATRGTTFLRALMIGGEADVQNTNAP